MGVLPAYGTFELGHTRRKARLVFVVGGSKTECATIELAIRGVADEVRCCTTLREIDLNRVVQAASVIVIAPDDSATQDDAIREYRLSDPGTPILLCNRLGSRTLHQLGALARAGLDSIVAVENPAAFDDLRREIAHRLWYAFPNSLVRVALRGVHHQEARAVCAWCYRNADRPLHVESVSTWFREDRKTIFRQLRAAGLPSLHNIIAIARLLHIAVRLDSTSAPIERIAVTLHFSSAYALRMLVKRATGRSASQLRSYGAISFVQQVLAAKVASS